VEEREHVLRNAESGTAGQPDYAVLGRNAWGRAERTWGVWGVPERELKVLGDVAGRDVLELGCGTAYWSAWLTGRGARVVGLDNSLRQLETARALQREFGAAFPLIQANAEEVPLADASFDLVLSEYGASIWCDPYRWVPEAARVLRPGGELVFLRNHVLLLLCQGDGSDPAGDRLVRDHFGLHRVEWSDDESVEFHLPHGEWIHLFRAHGLEVEDLIEVRAPAGAPPNRWGYVTPEWARRWPSEEIWKVRRGWPSKVRR
jgi:SAM-dependent methyltransferase